MSYYFKIKKYLDPRLMYQTTTPAQSSPRIKFMHRLGGTIAQAEATDPATGGAKDLAVPNKYREDF